MKTKALYNQNTVFNISFDGKNVEDCKLNGTLVWSRPNLFFTHSLNNLPLSRFKVNDIAFVSAKQNGEYGRAESIESEAAFSVGTWEDGYYLILGE